MDECREEIMDTYVECLQQARERLKQLKNIKLIEAEHCLLYTSRYVGS